jgi:peptidoglycan/LPS O-acetylase OafA/YrhL
MTEERRRDSEAATETWTARVRRRSENPRWWTLYIGAVSVCLVIGAVITVVGGNYAAGAALEGTLIVWAVVLLPVGRRAGRRAEASRAKRLQRKRMNNRL